MVEAVFDIDDCPAVKVMIEENGMEADEQQLIIRRSISKGGKNRIFIGDRLSTVQMLALIGGQLIDISGQYSQQLLLQTERHIDILDSFGDCRPLCRKYQNIYREFQDKAQELKLILTEDAHRSERRELLMFQNDEITGARLIMGEDEDLLRKKNILSNAQSLYDRTYGAYLNIYEDDDALLVSLKKNLSDVKAAEDIDPELGGLRERIEAVLINLEDAAFSLRDYSEKIHMDQERLDAVETRLDEIQRLKRKYGRSIEEIITHHKKIEKELKVIERSSGQIEGLRKYLIDNAEKLWEVAGKLSKKRDAASNMFKKKVEAELKSIGMEKAVFSAKITKKKKCMTDNPENSMEGLTLNGMDSVEFYISPNKGEDLRPLAKIASGGEISRIVLAIKKILAGNYGVSTLIFDEVDSGIGGAVAESVGTKLREIALSHQVLCITHLPQIACFGNSHHRVNKNEKNGRTLTSVNLLDDEERVEEISRMLGGKSISNKTREHAMEMIQGAAVKSV